MTPVSQVRAGAAQPLAAAGTVTGTTQARRPGAESQARPPRPVADEYVPSEKRQPCGLYRLAAGEDGRPKIYFDDPERAADSPETPDGAPAGGGPERDQGEKAPEEKRPAKKTERCAGDTGKVDREIRRLKKRRAELERRLNAETDQVKIRDLERKLAQVEGELRQKDNDSYRRRHAAFS